MTDEQLKKLLTGIAGCYGSKFNPGEATFAAWRWILGGEDYNAAGAALRVYMASGEAFPPVPGQILQEIKRASKKLPAYQMFELPPPVAKIKSAAELVALAKTELSKKSKNKSVK